VDLRVLPESFEVTFFLMLNIAEIVRKIITCRSFMTSFFLLFLTKFLSFL